jgi:protein-S-isoprenylcysteine O-methyltransferase Ste14
LRYVWILALPFLFFSRPDAWGLLVGACVSLLGLCLRAFASGCIHKEEELATGGPYGIVRHPLYVGSFLVGFGLSLASGRGWLVVAFAVSFFWLYGRTVRAEEEKLEALFGESFQRYRRDVPAFLPSLRCPAGFQDGRGFQPWLYWRNKEWQAAVGTLAGYGLLWARMWLSG